MKFGIDKFSGTWISEDSYRLEITIIDASSALVSFCSPDGLFVNRPYFNDKPTVKMPAAYDDYSGEFTVYLWELENGFELDIHYQEKYELDQSQRASLIPSLIRFEEDQFLDKYYKLFGNLKHFTKINSVNNSTNENKPTE